MSRQGVPNAPRSLSAPFGFVRSSDLPTEHHKEFLTFTIPSDEMRMSEARAWADSQALQWARVNRTVIVGTVEWRVTEDTICALVRTTIPPRVRGARPLNDTPLTAPRVDSRPKAPHPGCAICEDVSAFGPELTNAAVADALGIARSTVTRHREARKAKP